MCLYSKTNIPSIAEKDIVCYKVAELIDSNTCQTPFRGTLLDLNKVVFAEGKEDIYCLKIINIYSIGEGFIHAYTDKDMAGLTKMDLVGYNQIFECIIPKGSKYFIGCNNDICSNQMIIKYERTESN